MKYFWLLFLVASLQAQPAIPPSLTRQYIWTAPIITNNVGGYILKWGTNSLVVTGALVTNVVIPLQPGVNEVVLRSASIINTNLSTAITNRAKLLTFSLERSTNGANGPWIILSNYSYALSPTFSNEIFRSKLLWNTN